MVASPIAHHAPALHAEHDLRGMRTCAVRAIAPPSDMSPILDGPGEAGRAPLCCAYQPLRLSSAVSLPRRSRTGSVFSWLRNGDST